MKIILRKKSKKIVFEIDCRTPRLTYREKALGEHSYGGWNLLKYVKIVLHV